MCLNQKLVKYFAKNAIFSLSWASLNKGGPIEDLNIFTDPGPVCGAAVATPAHSCALAVWRSLGWTLFMIFFIPKQQSGYALFFHKDMKYLLVIDGFRFSLKDMRRRLCLNMITKYYINRHAGTFGTTGTSPSAFFRAP